MTLALRSISPRAQHLSLVPAPQSTDDAVRAEPAKPISGVALQALHAELLACYTPVVRQIAGGFQRKLPRNVLRDDLVAAGMSGLWDAIRKHGADGRDGFDWYVRVRIRGAMVDELRAQDWLPRRLRAKSEQANADGRGGAPAVVRIDDVSEWEQGRFWRTGTTCDAELAVEAKSEAEALAKAVESLPERERHIVAMHYFQGVKFKELGAELGVSEPRISQLHSRALERLRGLLEQRQAA
jgi:RNA polymerase sigma factor FliA